MGNKTDFLYAAIEDSQATIRAVDVKVGVLIIGLLAPFSNLGRIISHFNQVLISHGSMISYGLGFVFFTLWMLALLALIMAISAIDNPENHIASSSKFKGSFYGGGLYRFALVDALINRDVIKAEKDMASFSELVPHTEKDIDAELIFEHMKVIYIREIKLHRLKWAYRFSIAWFIAGLVVYIVSKTT